MQGWRPGFEDYIATLQRSWFCRNKAWLGLKKILKKKKRFQFDPDLLHSPHRNNQ